MTHERPWHVEVTEGQVEKAICILETVDADTGQIEYKADSDGRRFWFGSFQLGCFDMWGNLVICHELMSE